MPSEGSDESTNRNAQRKKEHYDALVNVEESAKQGIFAFATHWLMNSETLEGQQRCFDWLRDLADQLEQQMQTASEV